MSTLDEREEFDHEYADARLLGRWATRAGNVVRAVWCQPPEAAWVVVVDWDGPPSAADEGEFRTVVGPMMRARAMEVLDTMLPIPMLARETATRWQLQWPEATRA